MRDRLADVDPHARKTRDAVANVGDAPLATLQARGAVLELGYGEAAEDADRPARGIASELSQRSNTFLALLLHKSFKISRPVAPTAEDQMPVETPSIFSKVIERRKAVITVGGHIGNSRNPTG